MFIGLPIDGDYGAYAFYHGKISEKNFIRVWSPCRIKNAVAECHNGYAYIWNKNRKRKPWDETDKDHRASVAYKEWRLAVFTRDDFTCQECGTVRTNIQAHHIKTFNKHPKLRFEVSNGVTLCRPCHIKEHRGRNGSAM